MTNPKPISESETIRSDIEMTRRRMDDTIEALGDRMKGRHLIDEVIGYFRNNREKTSEAGARVREKFSQTAGKISEGAGSAANAVMDTVKQNPLPILLITAGAAWLAYNATRKRDMDFTEEDLNDPDRYDPDTHYDRPLAYPGTMASGMEEGTMGTEGIGEQQAFTDEQGSKFGQMKESIGEKASAASEHMKEKLSDVSQRTRDTLHNVKNRAGEIGSRVRERASEFGSQVQYRTREMYGRTRERVVTSADQHPVEIGLGCLAIGVLAGLAIPTPSPVHRLAGPTVDRLRNRTKDAGREMLSRGKRVVQAATSAAREEAQSQGLTPERLRQSGEAVAERAKEAAGAAARQEQPTGMFDQRAGAEPADPSAARPAM